MFEEPFCAKCFAQPIVLFACPHIIPRIAGGEVPIRVNRDHGFTLTDKPIQQFLRPSCHCYVAQYVLSQLPDMLCRLVLPNSDAEYRPYTLAWN